MTRRDFLGRLGLGAGILACAPILDLAPLTPAPSPYAGWVLHVSESPSFAFGFTGFQPTTDDVAAIAGQMIYRGVIQTRVSRMLHGVRG